MTDSMKFGPEWLRNLSHENNSNGNCSTINSNNSASGSSSTLTSSMNSVTTTSSVQRFQLAEFRYGREEMLALFDPGVLAPDTLKQINALYVEKTQTPLLMLNWSEEDTKVWNRGINSEVTQRVPGKGGQGLGNSLNVGSRGGLGGRGGSIDRGRGRGRGFSFNRGLSYDESEGGNSAPPTSYSRSIRTFDRDRMQGDRSNWSERNGDLERKDYSTSNREMSWRRHGEEDSWRTSRNEKWVRNSSSSSNNTNWREEMEKEPNHRNENSHYRYRHMDESNHNRQWESEDNLPEWATEKANDTGGSFDASGAFHGTNSDEDEAPFTRLEKPKSEAVTKTDTSPSNDRISSSNQLDLDSKDTNLNGASKLVNNNIDLNSKEANNPQDQSGHSPLRQSQSTSSISSNQPPTRKSSVPAQQTVEIPQSQPHPLTTSTSLSGMPPTSSVKTFTLSPTMNMANSKNSTVETSSNSQSNTQIQHLNHTPHSSATILPSRPIQSSMKLDDATDSEGMKLMQEVVAKLVDVDDNQLHVAHSKPPNSVSRPAVENDQWYYTDPQGQIQGPFSSAEMCEWYRSGYFNHNLMVCRANEKQFTSLGELVKNSGGLLPFFSDISAPLATKTIPVISEAAILAHANAVPDEARLPQQFHLQNFVHRQQAIESIKALRADNWNSLTPEQQILMCANIEQSMFPPQMATLPPNVAMPAAMPTTTDNSGALFIQKLQQAQAQAQQQLQLQQQFQQLQQQAQQQVQQQLQKQPPPNLVTSDPIVAGACNIPQIMPLNLQQSIHNLQQPPPPPKTTEGESSGMDIMSFLCQLQQNMALKQVDSVWSGPTPVPPTAVNHQVAGWTGMNQLWGDVPKMKTEQEILEEQRQEESRKKEELWIKNELKKKEEYKAAEEVKRRKKAEEEAERENKKKAEEEAAEHQRKKEEETKKKEAIKKAELEMKKEEEKRRKDEEKKKDEKRKKENEKKRLENEKKKLEEEKRKLEEEKRKEEIKRKEQEAKRTEQAKKQAEALKRLQEQAKATHPWSPPSAPSAPSTSLSEIVKNEKKQQQQLRELQQQQQLLQEAQAAKNQPTTKPHLKWADRKLQPTVVKSLAEIQAEEHENLIAKQQEKEKSNASVASTTSSGIWSGQNHTWSNHTNSVSVWGNATATTGSSSTSTGFWEDVSPLLKNQPKPNSKSSSQAKSSVSKTKSKKDADLVMKIFEKNKPLSDEFFNWCNKILSTMQSNVDIPTFVSFLRDLEEEYEVREYVRLYLGESKEASDFACQFIDKRLKMTRSTRNDNSTSTPAASNHFTEVKGKSKKPKKNKMMRVDNKILGFNVTAAPDRINVGDRDYVDGV